MGQTIRFGVSLDSDLLEKFDALCEERCYQTRSEAIRDLLRAGLLEPEQGDPQSACVATLSYVYDHATRELSKRLNTAFHEHHDLTLSTLHVHLDQGKCMEVSVLKGTVGEVAQLTRQVMAERGVRHGSAQIIPLGDLE